MHFLFKKLYLFISLSIPFRYVLLLCMQSLLSPGDGVLRHGLLAPR
jgi:hypothetical protein